MDDGVHMEPDWAMATQPELQLGSDCARMHTMPTPPLLLTFLVCFGLFTPVCRAQAAINSIANSPLPFRNVLIEVRQVQSRDTQNAAVQSSATLRADSAGTIDVQGQLQARQGQQQQSDKAVQQVLVLNGRAARINLGARVPLRVVQTYVRNGTLIAVPTTLVWESGTGFTATPRWDGSNTVELELGAQQTSNSNTMGVAAGGAGNVGRSTTQTTTSTLAVPLGQWTTVAQSDNDSDGQRNDLGGNARSTTQASSEVQVRLTLP
jgi:hypothetical protein